MNIFEKKGIKQMLELAGVDTSKGKARMLVETEDNNKQQMLKKLRAYYNEADGSELNELLDEIGVASKTYYEWTSDDKVDKIVSHFTSHPEKLKGHLGANSKGMNESIEDQQSEVAEEFEAKLKKIKDAAVKRKLQKRFGAAMAVFSKGYESDDDNKMHGGLGDMEDIVSSMK